MPIECVCLECGKEFKCKPCSVKRGRGKFCSKECQYKNMSKRYIGDNNPNYNHKWSNEKKILFSHSRIGERNPYYKGDLSKEYIDELYLKEQQRIIDKEEIAYNLHLQKISYIPSLKNIFISRLVNTGKTVSESTRHKISESSKGKVLSDSHRRNISESHMGARSNTWKGGISFEPYCQKFNKEFKERVRYFWNHTCGECGKTQEEVGKKLSVHHVHYDKKVCCNDKPAMFIPLCCKCHMKTNHNREVYENKYENLINEKYGGKSYYTKEEYYKSLKILTPTQQNINSIEDTNNDSS